MPNIHELVGALWHRLYTRATKYSYRLLLKYKNIFRDRIFES